MVGPKEIVGPLALSYSICHHGFMNVGTEMLRVQKRQISLYIYLVQINKEMSFRTRDRDR